jgi:hypothetical protein
MEACDASNLSQDVKRFHFDFDFELFGCVASLACIDLDPLFSPSSHC